MRPSLTSLRSRLIFWLAVPLVGAAMLVALQAAGGARQNADTILDRVLLSSALAIADRVIIESGGAVEVDVPYVALDMLTSAAQNRVFYRVADDAGGFVTGYRDLPAPDEVGGDLLEPTIFFDSTYRGEAIRAVALWGALSGPTGPQGYTVIVAETTETRAELAREFTIGVAARSALLIAIALVIVWFGVSYGLRPLGHLEQALKRRNPDDLRPVATAVPTEVGSLVEAINGLMARLGGAIEAQRRFAGNAGHQLRTPLSVIKTWLGIADRTSDEHELRDALKAANQAASEAERVIAQLFVLARIDAGAAARTEPAAMDLAVIARDATRERVPAALAAGLDLGHEGCAEGVLIRGDRVLVEELVLNLIDNAIRHAGAGHSATVSVSGTDKEALLTVCDDGPGIAAERRKEALQRFSPLAAGNGGAGLGLSIAMEIASVHGGRIELANGTSGRGLTVRTIFPRIRSPKRSRAQERSGSATAKS